MWSSPTPVTWFLQVQQDLWPFAVYSGLVIVIVSVMLLVSWLLGERSEGWTPNQPYESGVMPTGTARVRFNAQFYLIALDFVMFDVEVMYFIAWAVALKEAGWTGYVAMLVFSAVLLLTLAYLWRVGALDWGSRRFGAKSHESEVAET